MSVMTRYLAQVYRRDILGESVGVEMPPPDPKLIEEIEAELARIDALRLGANLVNRDFASYQSKRALEQLLAQLRASAQQPEEVKQLEPPQELPQEG
jgi:hypothetical protein